MNSMQNQHRFGCLGATFARKSYQKTTSRNAVARTPRSPCWYAARSLVASLSLVLGGCAQPATNFSQYPGFAEYFSRHPPSRMAPNLQEQALLEQYRPRLLLPPEHPGPIDFYRDYITHGELRAGDGRLISAQVTPEILNAHKHGPLVCFVHRAPKIAARARATVFGRVDRAVVELGSRDQRELMFLTYHVVFRHSGLPAAFDGWRATALRWFADLDDWHQLDHYTAATVVLDQRTTPVALMLQQHNYFRTYVIGADVALAPDGRPLVDVAIRSNELYPHVPGRTRRRAVRFIDIEEQRYMLGFAAAPTMSADDITQGETEATYDLAFLPHDDAFYTFEGFLGERRRLPGRDGPPGADYNTLPQLKPLGAQLVFGFWREGNRDDLARFEASWAKTGNPLDFARAQAAVLSKCLDSPAPRSC
jgi:hypothetical protein